MRTMKDLTIDAPGALITMLIAILFNMIIQKDFSIKWKLSLSVKNLQPLGEDEIKRLLRE